LLSIAGRLADKRSLARCFPFVLWRESDLHAPAARKEWAPEFVEARQVPVASSPKHEPSYAKQQRQKQGDQPPKAFDSIGHNPLRAEFALGELVVIEGIVRKPDVARVSFVGPTGLLVSATFGAGVGMGRHVGAAIRTGFGCRRHGNLLAAQLRATA